MNVLVAYATHHGATKGIAEQIAAILHDAGLSADAKPVDQIRNLDRYDAFVIGAAPPARSTG